MALRKDLAYEKSETEVSYIFTGAADIDESLEKALLAVLDAQKFRERSRATGVDVVRKDVSWSMALGFFVAGAVCCLLVLWCLGVI